MTGPDYPLLTVPGFELYQLAQLATFVADALARHRRAAEAGARRAAARDVHAGRIAFARATGTPDLAGGPLPRPLGIETFREAEQRAQPSSAPGGPAGDGFAAADAALAPPRSLTPRPATPATPDAPAPPASVSQTSIRLRQQPGR